MAMVYVDDKNFKQEVSNFRKPKILFFSAGWCPHCHRMKPVAEEIASRYQDRVQVYCVDVSHAPKTVAKYAVRGVPMMLFFKDGKPVSQLLGECSLSTIEEKVKCLLK